MKKTIVRRIICDSSSIDKKIGDVIIELEREDYIIGNVTHALYTRTFGFDLISVLITAYKYDFDDIAKKIKFLTAKGLPLDIITLILGK